MTKLESLILDFKAAGQDVESEYYRLKAEGDLSQEEWERYQVYVELSARVLLAESV